MNYLAVYITAGLIAFFICRHILRKRDPIMAEDLSILFGLDWVGVLFILLWPIYLPGCLFLSFKFPGAADTRGSNSEPVKHWIGRQGVAASDLAPAGTVEIDGEIIAALATGGVIERGTTVTVIDEDSLTLKVERAGRLAS